MNELIDEFNNVFSNLESNDKWLYDKEPPKPNLDELNREEYSGKTLAEEGSGEEEYEERPDSQEEEKVVEEDSD